MPYKDLNPLSMPYPLPARKPASSTVVDAWHARGFPFMKAIGEQEQIPAVI